MGMTTRNLVPLRRVFVRFIVFASFVLALTTATVDTGNQAVREKSLLTGSNVPVPVRAVLERACQDCHSENTVWPWYSHIPPVSWQIHTCTPYRVQHARIKPGTVIERTAVKRLRDAADTSRRQHQQERPPQTGER